MALASGMHRLLLSCAVALLIVSSLPARSSQDLGARIDQLLAGVVTGGGPPREHVIAELRSMGAELPPLLVARLGRPGDLNSDQADVALEALASQPHVVLCAYMRWELNRGELSEELRTGGMRMMAELSGLESLELLIELARSGSGETLPQSRALVFRDALLRYLPREGSPYDELGELLAEESWELKQAAQQVVGSLDCSRGLEYLTADLKDVNGNVQRERQLLIQAARVAGLPRVDLPDQSTMQTLTAYLDVEPISLRIEAVQILSRLGDSALIPRLIELLSDRNPVIRERALIGLQLISATRLPADPERWQVWYDEESQWLDSRANALFDQLRARDSAVVFRAMQELSQVRLFRRRIATGLTRALWHHDSNVRVAACVAMQIMDSPAAVPALVDVLGDTNQAVVKAAHQALLSITNVPVEFGDVWAWKRVLDEMRGPVATRSGLSAAR